MASLLRPRSEPVYFVAVQPKTSASVRGPGVAPSALNAAISKVAELDSQIEAIKALGTPNAFNATKLVQLHDQLSAAEALVNKLIAGVSPTQAAPPPVEVNPSDISKAITSFEYEEGEKKVDLLKLTIENRDLRWFDTAMFEKGTKLIVTWGYIGQLAPPREVTIQKVKGSASLSIEAHGKGAAMNKVARTRSFTNVTRAEVVRRIAEENGFGKQFQYIDDGPPSVNSLTEVKRLEQLYAQQKDVADTAAAAGGKREPKLDAKVAAVKAQLAAARVNSTKQPPTEAPRFAVISQGGRTDAQFLKYLADLQGFEFYTDFDGLHWHPRRVQQKPAVEYNYYVGENVGDIKGFEIDNDITAKSGSVTVAGKDPRAKTDLTTPPDNASTPRTVLAPVTEVVDPVTGETYIKPEVASVEVKPTGETTAAGAKAEAQGQFTRAQQSAIKLDLDMVGDPSLLSKMVILIKGLGKRLSGRYYVTEITHRLDSSGYSMKVKTRTDGTNAKAGALAKTAGAPNTKEPDATSGNAAGALTPVEVVDPVTGETKTIYVDTRGKGADAPKAG